MSNTLHNAIMEAGSKDRPPMLAPGSPVTTTERYMETYKNVSQDIRDQLNAEVEAVQIILTGIDNDIYSTVDACPNAFNEIRAKRIARNANPLALVAQQQPIYNPQNQPTNYTQNSSTRSQQAATKNRGKSIVNSHTPIYDQEPSMVAEDDEMSKDKEIDKLMALISLSFKKIYKPTNNNLRTSSNTSQKNQDNYPRIHRGDGYDNQRLGNVDGARETIEQADWRDDNDDESEDQELEAHYMYMAKLQEVTPDGAENSGPIFDTEPLEKNNDDNDLANERELLASLIEKLKCEINESKNHNKFLKTSNKVSVKKLKGEIKDFKNKNKSLESSNNCFKEANNELSETNKLMYNDFKKLQAELERRNSMKYALKVEIDCAKSKGDLISYKMESQNSFNKYTQTINDLNQTISEMKNKLSSHQETISILSQAKKAQIKLYKTQEDKELEIVIALENKVKVLDNIVYKTSQSVQTMNMLNSKCRMSFAKPEFFKKAQRANPRFVYIELDEVTNLQCDYLETLEKCECLEKELLKSKMMSKSFELLQKHAVNLELDLQQCKEKIKNDKSFYENQSKDFCKEREQYFEIQNLKAQLQDKGIAISELKKLIKQLKGKSVDTKFEKSLVIRQPNAFKSQMQSILGKLTSACPFLKSNRMKDRVMLNNSQGKKQEVEYHHRNVKFSKNKKSVTACNDSLNAKTLNVTFVCATCGKCMLNEKHDMCVLESRNGVNSRTKIPVVVPVLNHMTGNLKLLINFVKKFLGTMKFGNDQIVPILGYGDLVQGAVTIKRVYYVEGLNHNLFSVGQFCDADLEVAFRKSTCYIRDLKGNDLLTSSRGIDLYSITLQDTTSPNLICLMAKVTLSQAWLWYHRLSHLNFDTINLVLKNDIVIGLLKLKFIKIIFVHLVSWGKPNESLFNLRLPQAPKDGYNFYT
nr:integrase, catalytic region, zinc finger, CCHC-type, peptidase aspartic, catalytic [Tanacetum cinerariifolium]